MKSHIVLGLGFGDEGKGLVVDNLCSKLEKPIVIRFSGGQQAGHTVMIGSKKHVHSNYGAGTLRGVPSYFSEHTSIYLNTLINERDILREKGVEPVLYVHPLAKLTTPYDVAWNRYWEKKNNHGSVGLGIAATHKRANEAHYNLFATDLKYKEVVFAKIFNIKVYYENQFKGDPIALKAFRDLYFDQERFFFDILNEKEIPFEISGYAKVLNNFENLIFEGSQGIMLDETHGFFPNVTYGNTTSKNVWDILIKSPRLDIETYYVTRCYQTRHGAGWMSNQKPIELVHNEEEINELNPWQGQFKTGELDYELLNHAIDIDKIYNYRDKNLVVTCCDQRPDYNFEIEKFRHNFKQVYFNNSPYSGSMFPVNLKQTV